MMCDGGNIVSVDLQLLWLLYYDLVGKSLV